MEAYKFETIIQKNGIIQIPEIAKYLNYNVELFLVISPQKPQLAQSTIQIEEFLEKWTGFLKGVDPDGLKYQYLQEKYE